jgi:hypothetical protein
MGISPGAMFQPLSWNIVEFWRQVGLVAHDRYRRVRIRTSDNMESMGIQVPGTLSIP